MYICGMLAISNRQLAKLNMFKDAAKDFFLLINKKEMYRRFLELHRRRKIGKIGGDATHHVWLLIGMNM